MVGILLLLLHLMKIAILQLLPSKALGHSPNIRLLIVGAATMVFPPILLTRNPKRVYTTQKQLLELQSIQSRIRNSLPRFLKEISPVLGISLVGQKLLPTLKMVM